MATEQGKEGNYQKCLQLCEGWRNTGMLENERLNIGNGGNTTQTEVLNTWIL